MDEHIFPLESLENLIKNLRGKVVLAGGCFDILHYGHFQFLKAARQHGEMLVILLESDEKIKSSKGKDRPKNPQLIRAGNLLKSTEATDIIMLKGRLSNNEYDRIVTSIKPAIIATTENDPYKIHKDRQAALVGARVIEVVKRLEEYSTTKIINGEND